MSGRASQLCLWALGNMGPRTALLDGAAEGVVRPWCRGERPGEDCWRLCLAGRGGESLGRGGRWEEGVLSVAVGACQGWPSSRLPWTLSDQPSGCWMMRAGEQGGVQGGGDGGECVSAAGVSVRDIHDCLEVVREGDNHGGVWAKAEAGDADDAGARWGGTDGGEGGDCGGGGGAGGGKCGGARGEG